MPDVTLTDNEKLELEYRTYEYQALQIALNQFINDSREYNQEHYDQLINTYIDKYTVRQKCLESILLGYGISKIPKNFSIMGNKLILRW